MLQDKSSGWYAEHLILSFALRADAACRLTCAYMAGALLVVVALTTVFGWWWADGVVAFALLYWIALEALEAARSGLRGWLLSRQGQILNPVTKRG